MARGMEGDRNMATRAACYAGYAFLLLANILSYHATTAFASVPSFDDGTYMPVLGATHAAAFVAVALRYRNVAHEPLGSKAAGFAAVALCIGFALVPGSCSAGVQPGFVAGTVLIGVGQAVLSLLWLSALPMFSYRTSYLFLLGSHAAATALCAIVLQYPQDGTSPSPWHRCWRHAPAPPGCASHGPSSAPSPAR